MKKTNRIVLYISFFISSHFFVLTSPAQGSLDYDGSDDFINLPSGLVSSLSGDYTIEMWIYWRGPSSSIWSRVFDFGTGTTFNMFLTPNNGATNTPRFAITQSGNAGEQLITAPSALSINTWHHMAVVTTNATSTTKLFIDGSAVATTTAITIRPSALGTTNQNYLGRSQYSVDPYFNGYIDEFRISNNIRYTSTFTPQHSIFSVDANTIALYHFNEGSGQTINDATGNFSGFRGATTGSESSDPAWAALTVLPVGITELKATRSWSAVQVSWETLFEQNNKGFYIERSGNGINYSSIAFVNGTGNSSGSVHYTYTDNIAPTGFVSYRLKQEDIDGKFTYSNIASLTINKTGAKLYWYAISKENVAIGLTSGNNEMYCVKNMNGQTIQNGSLSNGKAILSSLPKGLYVVSITTKEGSLLSAKFAY